MGAWLKFVGEFVQSKRRTRPRRPRMRRRGEALLRQGPYGVWSPPKPGTPGQRTCPADALGSPGSELREVCATARVGGAPARDARVCVRGKRGGGQRADLTPRRWPCTRAHVQK